MPVTNQIVFNMKRVPNPLDSFSVTFEKLVLYK